MASVFHHIMVGLGLRTDRPVRRPEPDDRYVTQRGDQGPPQQHRRAQGHPGGPPRPPDGHHPAPRREPERRPEPARSGTVYHAPVRTDDLPPVPQERSWAAPIVGAPVADFEPRPPLTTGYRPDTIADGWSTELFTIRVASVRGYDHRHTGAPRQDDVAVVEHPGSGAVLFAIADGVSEAPLSHIGAMAVCRSAISVMTDGLDSPERQVDWPGLARQAAWQLCEQARITLGLPEVDQLRADREMATTLVAGMVLPGRDGPRVHLVQVGDSSAWILRRGAYQCLLPTKHHPGAEVFSSAVTALPRVPDDVQTQTGILAADEVLLVGTDGFGDPLGDGDGQVGRHFAAGLRSVPTILKFANDLDFSKETWDDDRTLFALWPRRRH
jgi:serine/threonine protein phosphatase PrpC